jgi:hypothetical protein
MRGGKSLFHCNFFYYYLFLTFFFSLCLIADYCQNLSIPHFGLEQPDDMYYFSTLFVYCFDFVDASQSPEVLHAFGYTEGTALIGGNNVASLLAHSLKLLGWLILGEPAQRLSIIMDTCAG